MNNVFDLIKGGVALLVTAGLITTCIHLYNTGEKNVTSLSQESYGITELEQVPLTAYKTKLVSGEDVLQCCRQYGGLYEIHIQTIAMQNATDISGVIKDYFIYGDFDPVLVSEDPAHKGIPTSAISCMDDTIYDAVISVDLNGDGAITGTYATTCYVDNDVTKGLKPYTDEHALEDHPDLSLAAARAAGHKKLNGGSEVSVVNPYWVNPDGNFLATITKNNGEYIITFRQELK